MRDCLIVNPLCSENVNLTNLRPVFLSLLEVEFTRNSLRVIFLEELGVFRYGRCLKDRNDLYVFIEVLLNLVDEPGSLKRGPPQLKEAVVNTDTIQH